MRKPTLIALAVSATMAVSAFSGGAQAAPTLTGASPLTNAVYVPTNQSLLQEVQYFYGGRNYCWYEGGWRGAGYYLCGYAGRRGYGWGGARGWNGWDHRVYRPSGYEIRRERFHDRRDHDRRDYWRR